MHVDPEEIRNIVESASFKALLERIERDYQKILLSTAPEELGRIEETRRDWLALHRLRQEIQGAAKKVG